MNGVLFFFIKKKMKRGKEKSNEKNASMLQAAVIITNDSKTKTICI